MRSSYPPPIHPQLDCGRNFISSQLRGEASACSKSSPCVPRCVARCQSDIGCSFQENMRRHSLKKLWVVVVLLLVGSWHLDAPGAAVLQVDGGAPVPDCEEWNTPEFFETATVEDVTACLAAGADVNARTEDGYTPLHHAAWGNVNAAVVEALLDAGANAAARGLFLEAAAVPDATRRLFPEAPDSVALRSRLVTIDFRATRFVGCRRRGTSRRHFGRGAPFGSARVRRVAQIEPIRRHGVHGRGRANRADVFGGLCDLGQTARRGGGHNDARRERRRGGWHDPDVGDDLPHPTGRERAAHRQRGRSVAAAASGRANSRRAGRPAAGGAALIPDRTERRYRAATPACDGRSSMPYSLSSCSTQCDKLK